MQKLNKEELKREPMDDSDIRHYLGNESRIISYSDLNNFNTIEEILPRNKTYFILLYQLDSPSSGHWAIITRMNDIIEYADANNMEIQLNPAVKDERKGTTSRNRLVRFYKNFGFIENTGRNIDYRKI